MKSKDMVRAENSLREFILEEYSNDEREQQLINIYKYKGMSLNVGWKPNVRPQFEVEIGAFAATFSIETGRKIEGNLQDYDIALISKWAIASINRNLLLSIWITDAKDKKDVRLKPFDMK